MQKLLALPTRLVLLVGVGLIGAMLLTAQGAPSIAVGGAVSQLDLAILGGVNGLATRSGGIDTLVRLLDTNHLFKGVPVMMLFWALWFADDRVGRDVRPKLVALLGVALVAIVVGRVLALVLPFRLRPLHTPGLDINLPAGMDPATTLDGWSSMPSDHAVLFFALAVGFFFVNRWAGLAALVHAVLVVSLTRVYLALHFPTDILAGALLGAAISLALVPPASRALAARGIVRRIEALPYAWYPLMFVVTSEAASMFVSARRAASGLLGLTIDFLT